MDCHVSKPVILVVEDDASLRRLMVRMLNTGGYSTHAAGNAADGLSRVRQCHGALDLAIIDMVMPGRSGLDLASDLDREYPGLKILYMSGYVDSLAADVIARRSPDCLLLKPFTRQVLLDRVRRLLETTSRRQPGRASPPPPEDTRSGTVG